MNTMEIRIVPIWRVLAGPRRSIGAWSVLDTATLRPPSRTWRRTRTIRITAEVRVIICIIFLRTTGVYQKVFFLQFFLHLDVYCGNIKDMKTKYLLWYLAYTLYCSIFAISNSLLGTTSYRMELKDIFPTPSRLTTDNGIENISDYIIAMIPLVTTLMAIGATVMVVLGGFHMVLGWASSEQTEKWKGILKDAIIGLLMGLLAYVIIMTLWNILGV